MNGYIYVVQIREFVKSDEDVYKVGRTVDIMRRFKQYPKNSKLIAVFPTKDPVLHERLLLNGIAIRFQRRTDIGSEYFQCNMHVLIAHISKCILKLNANDCHTQTIDKCTQTTDTYTTEETNPFERFRCLGSDRGV